MRACLPGALPQAVLLQAFPKAPKECPRQIPMGQPFFLMEPYQICQASEVLFALFWPNHLFGAGSEETPFISDLLS